MNGRVGAKTLRERLREDTAEAHEALDRGFERFDLAAAEGLGGFLLAHHAALSSFTSEGEAEALRREALAAIEGDLAALGRAPGPVTGPAPEPMEPTAARYLLLGSRLGLRFLARRWAASPDPSVAGAGRLFALAAQAEAWRRFCEETGAEPAEGEAAEAAVAGAQRGFALYLAAVGRA